MPVCYLHFFHTQCVFLIRSHKHIHIIYIHTYIHTGNTVIIHKYKHMHIHDLRKVHVIFFHGKADFKCYYAIKMYSDHFLCNSTYICIHINIYEDMHAWYACHGHANKR